MKYYYDLHIHSVLSPCADILMTPNNIINMANLKGIQIISITDHNSLKQYQVIQEIIQSYDMLLIYGVEVEISDGSHILCYFKNIKDALTFDSFLESKITQEELNLNLYNPQVITDNEDLEVSQIPYLLGKSLDISLDLLIKELNNYQHLRFLAHVDRAKNSGIAYLGKYRFDGIEYTKNIIQQEKDDLMNQSKYLVFNSDAHHLTDILERGDQNMIELASLSIDSFFSHFQNG